jgi:hypothetical protein
MQVPAFENDTAPPLIEHTPLLLVEYVTSSPEDAVAAGKYGESPTRGLGAGVEVLILWIVNPTPTGCCT